MNTTTDERLAEILDCPFCGLPPEVEPWHGGGKKKHAVSCPHDVCRANPMVTGPTRRAAINNWNYREPQARRAAETLPESDLLDARFRDICPNCSLTGFYRGVFDAGVRAGRAAETDMVLDGAAIDLEDRLGKALDELGSSIERNAQLEARFRELAELYTAATGRKVPVDAALSARPTT